MKISTITRIISQLVFWGMVIIFYKILGKLNDSIYSCLLTMWSIVGAGYIARNIFKSGYGKFLAHIACLIAPAVSYSTGNTGIAVMILGISYVFLSYCSILAKQDFMERGHGFQQFLVIAMYLVAIGAQFNHIYVFYGLMCLYTLVYMVQCVNERNEDYVQKIVESSVMDANRMIRFSDFISTIVISGMMLFCLLISLLGKVGPLGAFSHFVRNKILFFFGFMKDLTMTKGSATGLPAESPTSFIEEETTAVDGPTIYDVTDSDSTIGLIRFIIFLLIVFGLLAFQFYKWYKNRPPKIVHEEVITIFAKKEKKPKKVNPRKTDPSYGNRKTARKLYKRRLKGVSNGKRQDLETRTPHEQKNKVNEDGNNVSAEFVDMYERARYSNQKISKDDIKKMNKL